jgi:hypothetical protein
MPNTKPSSWKQCTTCQYWAGPRKADFSRTRVEYSSDQDKGECVGGGWNRQQKSASMTCGKWEKWGVLK